MLPNEACKAGERVKPRASALGEDANIIEARKVGDRAFAIARFTG